MSARRKPQRGVVTSEDLRATRASETALFAPLRAGACWLAWLAPAGNERGPQWQTVQKSRAPRAESGMERTGAWNRSGKREVEKWENAAPGYDAQKRQRALWRAPLAKKAWLTETGTPEPLAS